jgi:hypothetical protein
MAPGFETFPLGSHPKMELISRQAYGFRNFENYRILTVACMATPRGRAVMAAFHAAADGELYPDHRIVKQFLSGARDDRMLAGANIHSPICGNQTRLKQWFHYAPAVLEPERLQTLTILAEELIWRTVDQPQRDLLVPRQCVKLAIRSATHQQFWFRKGWLARPKCRRRTAAWWNLPAHSRSAERNDTGNDRPSKEQTDDDETDLLAERQSVSEPSQDAHDRGPRCHEDPKLDITSDVLPIADKLIPHDSKAYRHTCERLSLTSVFKTLTKE